MSNPRVQWVPASTPSTVGHAHRIIARTRSELQGRVGPGRSLPLPNPQRPFRFHDLPAELRIQIYNEVAVPIWNVVPPTNMMLVSRQINAEVGYEWNYTRSEQVTLSALQPGTRHWCPDKLCIGLCHDRCKYKLMLDGDVLQLPLHHQPIATFIRKRNFTVVIHYQGQEDLSDTIIPRAHQLATVLGGIKNIRRINLKVICAEVVLVRDPGRAVRDVKAILHPFDNLVRRVRRVDVTFKPLDLAGYTDAAPVEEIAKIQRYCKHVKLAMLGHKRRRFIL